MAATIRVDDERYAEAEEYIDLILDSEKLPDPSFVLSIQKQMNENSFLTERQFQSICSIKKAFNIED